MDSFCSSSVLHDWVQPWTSVERSPIKSKKIAQMQTYLSENRKRVPNRLRSSLALFQKVSCRTSACLRLNSWHDRVGAAWTGWLRRGLWFRLSYESSFLCAAWLARRGQSDDRPLWALLCSERSNLLWANSDQHHRLRGNVIRQANAPATDPPLTSSGLSVKITSNRESNLGARFIKHV